MVLLVSLVFAGFSLPRRLELTDLPTGNFCKPGKDEILKSVGFAGFFQVFWLVFPWFRWFLQGFRFRGSWNIRICQRSGVEARSVGREFHQRLATNFAFFNPLCRHVYMKALSAILVFPQLDVRSVGKNGSRMCLTCRYLHMFCKPMSWT